MDLAGVPGSTDRINISDSDSDSDSHVYDVVVSAVVYVCAEVHNAMRCATLTTYTTYYSCGGINCRYHYIT